LFVVTAGYFGPDKLGMIYHTIHLAVHDLQTSLAKEIAGRKEAPQFNQALPAEVAVDKETQAEMDGIFSRASQTPVKDQADGYWEAVGESSASEDAANKEVLTYDQARQLGLAPGGEKPV
jgi:hypothetical protein